MYVSEPEPEEQPDSDTESSDNGLMNEQLGNEFDEMGYETRPHH